MVIRNDKGRYVRGKNMRVAGMVTVMEVEARGVQEAINWVEEMGLQGITI